MKAVTSKISFGEQLNIVESPMMRPDSGMSQVGERREKQLRCRSQNFASSKQSVKNWCFSNQDDCREYVTGGGNGDRTTGTADTTDRSSRPLSGISDVGY